MSTLLIDPTYDPNQISMIKIAIHLINQQYDINPNLIKDNFVEREHFDNMIKEKFNQMIKTNNPLLDELIDLNSSQLDGYVDKYLRWERDYCGFVENRHSNGYIEYCNKHRYQHEDIDHNFTIKNNTQIKDEQTFRLQYQFFKDFIYQVALQLSTAIMDQIKTSYQVIKCDPGKISKIDRWLKKNKHDFKEVKKCVDEDDDKVKINVWIEHNHVNDFQNMLG